MLSRLQPLTKGIVRPMLTTRTMSSAEISVELGSEIFSVHNFEAPGTTVTTTKEELIGFLKEMYTMRRMEITNDTEYKVR